MVVFLRVSYRIRIVTQTHALFQRHRIFIRWGTTPSVGYMCGCTGTQRMGLRQRRVIHPCIWRQPKAGCWRRHSLRTRTLWNYTSVLSWILRHGSPLSVTVYFVAYSRLQDMHPPYTIIIVKQNQTLWQQLIKQTFYHPMWSTTVGLTTRHGM